MLPVQLVLPGLKVRPAQPAQLELRELPVQRVMSELPVLSVQRELPALRVIRERRVQWALLGSRELPARWEQPDLLELLAQQVQQD